MSKNLKVGLVVGLILGVSLFAFAVMGCCGVLLLVGLATPENASCPTCGKEFRVPEEHRGNVSGHMRQYRCPRCGLEWPASVLYKPRGGSPGTGSP